MKNDALKKRKEETEDYADYLDFFNDCFERLAAHYPCPSVTSDYDKSVIFGAIERGEAVGGANHA